MTTTLEKMARALCTAAGNDPDLGPSPERARWRTYLPSAEAALLSIRELTKPLWLEGMRATCGMPDRVTPQTVAACHAAIIDAIRESRA